MQRWGGCPKYSPRVKPSKNLIERGIIAPRQDLTEAPQPGGYLEHSAGAKTKLKRPLRPKKRRQRRTKGSLQGARTLFFAIVHNGTYT